MSRRKGRTVPGSYLPLVPQTAYHTGNIQQVSYNSIFRNYTITQERTDMPLLSHPQLLLYFALEDTPLQMNKNSSCKQEKLDIGNN